MAIDSRMGDKFEMRSSRDGSDEMITHCEARMGSWGREP